MNLYEIPIKTFFNIYPKHFGFNLIITFISKPVPSIALLIK